MPVFVISIALELGFKKGYYKTRRVAIFLEKYKPAIK